MMNKGDCDRLLREFNRNPPADLSCVQRLQEEAGFRLPDSYVSFLLQADGGEGFVGDSYVILDRAEELVQSNAEREVEDYAPGLFIFGSNGGGEAFGFDTRDSRMSIVCVPFIVLDWDDALPMGSSFWEFLQILHDGGPFYHTRPDPVAT